MPDRPGARPRVAIATSSANPALSVDDRIFAEELNEWCDVEPLIWTDAPRARFDACVIRSTWDYHVRPDDFRQWVRNSSEAFRLFNSPALIEWNFHKKYLLELADCGVPVVPTVLYARGSKVDVVSEMAHLNWPEVVLKPAISASAYRTEKFDLRSERSEFAQSVEALLEDCDALVQPLRHEVFSSGERSAVFIDGRFSHVVKRLPFGTLTPNRDHEEEDLPSVSDRERHFAEDALRALPEVPLYARVDYIVTDSGAPLLMELEVIEPSLFFQHHPESAKALAEALLARIL